MGRMIVAAALEAQLDLTANEIDSMFIHYGRQQTYVSVEGIGHIAGNIAISFSDFVIKIGNNIRVGVVGLFKDIKRSSLRILFHSNKLGMSRLFASDYVKLVDVVCANYPFTVAPKKVAEFCKETFTRLEMHKRLSELIESYMRLAAGIRANDYSITNTTMDKIAELNMKSNLYIHEPLKSMVAPPSGTNRVTFGKIFDSVTEFKSVIELTLTQADELEVGMKVHKLLDLLYKAFEKIHEAVKQASTTEFDLSKLAGIGNLISDTGTLIEGYGMLLQEYHHLEYWLTTTSEECLTKLKQE